MRLLLIAAALLLASCAQTPQGQVTARQVSLPTATTALPPMKAFTSSAVTRPTRPNARIAGDFLDLTFQMETGQALPVLSR
ncbi:MAG TPA: ATP-dependent transcriptional regulator, partial [Aliiroseovarius sp.]|nr:ATP-dependent transcriptional regulator [Aliiroseovarius sp.]